MHHSQTEGSIELTESVMCLSLLLLLRLRLSPRCTKLGRAGANWSMATVCHSSPIPSPTSQPGDISRSAVLL